MDKSWMKITNRRLREYLDGVQQFLNFASNHAHSDGTISCPCKKCVHTNSWPIDVVEAHLVSKGICRGYNPWIFNGESSSAKTSTEIPNSHVQENQIKFADLRDMFPIQDMASGPTEEVPSVHQPTKESEKNKDRHSKQDDLHTAGSCSYAVHATKKAKTDGCPVEHAVLYQILHTRKDGFAVNPVVKAKMDKMKKLLVEPSNQLQSFDTSGSIALSTDDVFAKVMGKEHKGCIRGVGFGPSPSGRSSKSALTDIEIHSSQARDNEVAQLKASLATMEDKLASFDEMKKKLSQFEEMEQRMARMLQQMQQISSQCNQDVSSVQQSSALQKSSVASYQPSNV